MATETQPAPPLQRRARARLSRRESRQRIVAAATELVRTRSYAELSVDAVMREAGLGRTIFYRHFDDLLDLLLGTAREAVEGIYQAQLSLVEAGTDDPHAATRQAFEAAVAVYMRHGPLLRCIQEAAAGDEELAPGYAEMRRRFDVLAEQALRALAYAGRREAPPNLAEVARALNRMNETYLTDTFGREPRVEPEVAVQTLTQIWDAVINR
jgi:TetR/AcrR family transcriptional regulator, ethionamide resistance regulator